MDSYHNTNLPYTQTEFSSYALSKSIGAKKSKWISSSPKRKTMTQMTVKNNGTSNTKSLERNSLKRKSPFAISDIDSKIKRLEALHEETTTSDSETTITKIDHLSKKRKLSKPGEKSSDSEDLCKTLKRVNSTVNQITLLHPFSREEDIKIIRYFHKFMELLAHKDDIYVYQLLEMKYYFQRSAKFLRDRFLNEILPNLYVYDCLTLEQMVVFYDRADMLVPKHVQNLIREKVRSITGQDISSPESLVITISDAENEETDFIDNENVKSPCSSKSSSFILKRRKRVLQLSPSPSICSTNISQNNLQIVQDSDKDSCNTSPESHVITISHSENDETNLIHNENIKSCSSESSLVLLNRKNKPLKTPSSICNKSISKKTLRTVQNSDSDSCINSEVLSVLSSVNKEPNAVNVCDSAINHKTIETCQLVQDSDLSKHSLTSGSLCDENKSHRNVNDSKKEHSDNINRDKELENITTNTCNTAEGSSDCVSLSSCLFETSEKQQVQCIEGYNKQNAKHVYLLTTNFTKAVQSSDCNSNELPKSSQTIQNDQSHDNFFLHTDHTYVKLKEKIVDNVNVQLPDNTLSFSNETVAVEKEDISIKISDKESIAKTADTSSCEQKIQHSVKCISKRSFVDASTNTQAPVTVNKQTQLSSLDSHNIDSISCLERDVIELRMHGNSNIYVSKKVDVKKITKQYDILENSIHLTDDKNMEIFQFYTKYNSNINAAMKIFTEKKNIKDNNSRYNLRKFVKNPRSGTCTTRNWFKNGKKNVLDLLTNDCPRKVIKRPSRRSKRINDLFGIRQFQLGETKFYKKRERALWSPASDQSDETVSSVTASPISDTSTTKSDNKIYKKHSSGIVIKKTYLKENIKSTLNNQISKQSPETEEFNQSVSTVTSTNSVSNNPVSSGSDKPAITEMNTNTSVATLENHAISHISDVRNDYQKRICKKPESDVQNNTISPLITEKSNHSLSTVTSTSISNQSHEDSGQENLIFSINNNYEKRVYKNLESSITEESNKSATSTPASKKLVCIQINKNTGNILGLRPVRSNTDKKVISNTGTLKAVSVIDNSNGQGISESTNLTSTVSGSDCNTTNTCIDKTVSEETISSSHSKVSAYYDMEINIFEDVPCEYDPKCSRDGTTPVQKNQNIVKKANEMIVSTSRTMRNPVLSECTDDYSVIKPTRTYKRKSARTNPPESPCTVSVTTEPDDSHVKLEPLDSSDDSGLEMIASQLLLGPAIASTSCARASRYSSASDDVIQIDDSPNCILDFLVDDIKREMEDDTSTPSTDILDPIDETVPVNKEDVNVTSHQSFSTISEADSIWYTIKRIMSILESPIVLDDSESGCSRIVVKTTKNTQTDITSTTCNEEHDVRIKQELIEMSGTIKQEWLTNSDSWDDYPEMVFDCAKIKQEISILESNTITSPDLDEENFDPVLPVQLPNEHLQTHINMSRKLKAVVAENRLSIHHLKPATETEYTTEQIIKTEYSAGTELE